MIADCEINFNDFKDLSVKEVDKLKLIMFKGNWCQPCKKIYPNIVELAKEYPGVKFYKIDIDDESEIIKGYLDEFSPAKVPSFFYYKNGNIVDSIIGTDINKISDTIEKHL